MTPAEGADLPVDAGRGVDGPVVAGRGADGPVVAGRGADGPVGGGPVPDPTSGESVARRSGAALDALVAVMGVLRSECPWDRVQTHASLRRHLLEESYETLDALDRIAAGPDTTDASVRGTFEDLCEELGDVLFQVVFHAHLAAEEGHFDLTDVVDGVREKLVGRHPSIFGPVEGADAHVNGAEPLAARGAEWELAKIAEKERGSVMDGIPSTLPALLYASKVVGKADVVAPGLFEGDRGRVVAADEAALGRDLLATVLAARDAGLDAEAALRAAAREIEVAARAIERSAETAGDDAERR